MGLKVYSENLILCIMALGGLMLGFETTSMAVFIGEDDFKEYFDYPSPFLQGIIAGSSPGAAFCIIDTSVLCPSMSKY
jgi:hypothetical protein